MGFWTYAADPTVLLIILGILLVILYLLIERRGKKQAGLKFRHFSHNFENAWPEMRAVPRITIPDSLEVLITFDNGQSKRLKATVADISLSGLRIKPGFSPRKLSVSTAITNAQVITPVNTIGIKEMKTVRVDRYQGKQLFALHILGIEGEQFEELKKFMGYLDKFLRHEA